MYPKYREDSGILGIVAIPKIVWTFSEYWAATDNSELFEKRWIFSNRHGM
jgi:hypothetical protein